MEKGEGDPAAQIRYKRWPYIQVIERLIHKELASYFYECITCSVNHNPVLKECTQPRAVTYSADEILTNMDKGLVTAATVFIDLAKSFDTVDHEILLSKLEYYGVCDESLPWFKNYFSGRKQSVHIDSQSTEELAITYIIRSAAGVYPRNPVIHGLH